MGENPSPSGEDFSRLAVPWKTTARPRIPFTIWNIIWFGLPSTASRFSLETWQSGYETSFGKYASPWISKSSQGTSPKTMSTCSFRFLRSCPLAKLWERSREKHRESCWANTVVWRRSFGVAICGDADTLLHRPAMLQTRWSCNISQPKTSKSVPTMATSRLHLEPPSGVPCFKPPPLGGCNWLKCID